MSSRPDTPQQPSDAPKAGAPQPSLFDELSDQPVPYVLTARARRVVAPDSLPPLAVLSGGEEPAEDEVGEALAEAADAALDAPIDLVPVGPLPVATSSGTPPAILEDSAAEAEEDDDLDDPRRARARALRRAGSSLDRIATELGLEEGRIAAWTDDVAPAPSAVRRERAAERHVAEELPVAFVSGRAAARAAWARGTAVSSGAAMVAGLAEVTPFAVRLRGEVGVVAGVLQWLRDAVVVTPHTVSAQVAAAPGRAMDRVAHEVAARLQVELDRVRARPWAEAPDADAVEVTVRIADPHLAGTVAGWREALLRSLVGEGEDPGVAVAG